jgi:hypothetical protein
MAMLGVSIYQYMSMADTVRGIIKDINKGIVVFNNLEDIEKNTEQTRQKMDSVIQTLEILKQRVEALIQMECDVLRRTPNRGRLPEHCEKR